MSLITSDEGIPYVVYNFEYGLDITVDSYLNSFQEVTADYTEVFIDISVDGLNDLLFEIGYEINESTGSHTFYFIQYNGGITGFINNQQSALSQLEKDFSNKQFEYDLKATQITEATYI